MGSMHAVLKITTNVSYQWYSRKLFTKPRNLQVIQSSFVEAADCTLESRLGALGELTLLIESSATQQVYLD